MALHLTYPQSIVYKFGINLLSPIITKQIFSIMETGNYEISLKNNQPFAHTARLFCNKGIFSIFKQLPLACSLLAFGKPHTLYAV
jgi:hypothetical protein